MENETGGVTCPASPSEKAEPAVTPRVYLLLNSPEEGQETWGQCVKGSGGTPVIYYFLKISFIYRQRGREGEREREKN